MELKVGMKFRLKKDVETLCDNIFKGEIGELCQIRDKDKNIIYRFKFERERYLATLNQDPSEYFDYVKKDNQDEINKKTDPIVESVITKYLNRSKVGIEKYGTTLEENNKDNFLNHLQEELFDASLYVEKLMSQQTKTKFEELDRKIHHWFLHKDLIHEKNKFQQYTKFQEEAGELASAIIKKDEKARKDAFGDVLVTLLGLSYQTGDNLIECLEIAYNEIKNRKGRTENGTFIKD